MNKKYIFALIIVGFLAYSNTLKNPYVWDDGMFIQNNNFIKHFEYAKVFFSPKNYFRYTQDLTYRPLRFLVHMVNYKLFNTQPVGHRVVNIALHVVNAILIYFLVLLILKNKPVAFISGLFFMLHPVNTEVVNMVWFAETQLSTILLLLSLLLYIKSKDANTDVIDYSILCYFLGVFTKENVIVLPAIIILYDFIYEPEFKIHLSTFIKKYVPFFAVSVSYLVIRFFVFRHPVEKMIKYPGDSFITNIGVMLKTIPVYLNVIFWPLKLSVEHNISISVSFLDAPVILGIIGVLIFAVFCIYSYKKFKPVFFWLIWILITFLPTSNIIPMQNIAAERYLYLPLIGVCVVIAISISHICKNRLGVFYGVAFCAAIFLATFTFIRNRDWQDKTKFYTIALKQNQASPGANMNMAMIYSSNKDYKKAFEYANYALKLAPDYIDGPVNLASIYQDAGDYDKALEIYEKCVAEKKYQFLKAPFLNLGMIYKMKKQNDKAIENFNKAIELYPLSSNAYAYLGEICDDQGDYDTAQQYYEKSVDINPDYYIPFNALGVIYAGKGYYEEAQKCFKKAVKLKPDSADIHFNIGYVDYLTLKYGDALKEMGLTLRYEPQYERAKYIISQITGKTK